MADLSASKSTGKHMKASNKFYMSRIRFIRTVFLSALLLLAVSCTQHRVVRFGICADVHKDVMHDADRRLQLFIDKMTQGEVDFIIELGDFMQPQDYNASFLDIWNSFEGPAYHVLGNHDMDNTHGERFSREFTVGHLDMPSRYYSFDRKGFHFIVLDGNDPKDPPQEGYARYIGGEQLDWLQEDLAGTHARVIVFSHQSLEDPEGVENGTDVRRILEAANRQSGKKKVIACFSGHHHIDHATAINGIHYIQINSMSYVWLGGDYQHVRYGQEIDEQYPYIKYTTPYLEPVFATVEIDTRGTIRIHGGESSWVGPDPWELGYPEEKRSVTGPRISSRELGF
jgi:3',5'-cyclic AMP phosphodiesterase CpdA